MRTTKRFIAALAIAAVTTIGLAPAAFAGGKCSPGQHGNGHPGFKPGVCTKK